MASVQLAGGTGNILFQINFALYLRLHNKKVELLLPGTGNAFEINSYLVKTSHKLGFGVKSELAISRRFKSAFRRVFPWSANVIIDDMRNTFKPTSSSRLGTRFEGYWQNISYFGVHSEPLIQLLSHAIPKPKSLVDRISNLQTCKDNICLIHIRRGDFFSVEAAKAIHGLLGESYYRRCVRIIESQLPGVHFIITSDDAVWAKNVAANIISRPYDVIEDDAPGSGLENLLALSAHCGHAILSNSSYSWWLAYLIEALEEPKKRKPIILCPEIWYGCDEFKDISPALQHWVHIPVN